MVRHTSHNNVRITVLTALWNVHFNLSTFDRYDKSGRGRHSVFLGRRPHYVAIKGQNLECILITKHPMTLDEAVRRLRHIGCEVTESEEGYAVILDPGGNYLRLWGCAAEVDDGTAHVEGKRGSGDDATMMTDELNMVSEDEDEYLDIIGPGVPVSDEE
jgi:hypothetical protein